MAVTGSALAADLLAHVQEAMDKCFVEQVAGGKVGSKRSQVVTVRGAMEAMMDTLGKYNEGIDLGNIESDKHNQRVFKQYGEGKVTRAHMKNRLNPKRDKLKPVSMKQVRNWLVNKMGWMNTRQTKSCKYLDYNHPAMEKVREYVAHQSSPEHPQPVHPRLILNIDQVWTMRFSSQETNYFKPDATGGSSLYYIYIYIYTYIHIYTYMYMYMYIYIHNIMSCLLSHLA